MTIQPHALRSEPPLLRTEIPGPRSRALAKRLACVESRDITCLDPTPPIFWERALASNVWDTDGNRFIDLTAGFGVANAGHRHPAVVAAIQTQAQELLHAMGDVDPPLKKVELLETICALFPGGIPAKAILGSSGSDAVESALKTAQLATGRAGIIAFTSAYHGLTLGALDTTWRPFFREPFSAQIRQRTVFTQFGVIEGVEEAAQKCPQPVGAVIVEPIQGRGGERIPPRGFLRALREVCDRNHWLLICDEVYTGFGRTGKWFACEHEAVIPDLLCVGKGLASGIPISACLGRVEIMDAWPISHGEAVHTQTFLGHPVGCAAALASIKALREEGWIENSAVLGAQALAKLQASVGKHACVRDVRGMGLLLGIECDSGETALQVCARALERGVILLASGDQNQVLSITPPLSIEAEILEHALDIVIGCFP